MLTKSKALGLVAMLPTKRTHENYQTKLSHRLGQPTKDMEQNTPTSLLAQATGHRFSDYRVTQCDFSAIRHVFEGYHYKAGHMGGGISICYALIREGRIVGGAVYGKPRHAASYDKATLDLRRFALTDEQPKNAESFFLGRTIRDIAKKRLASKILTFADETQGHKGTIYKACNFKLVGITPPTKQVRWNGRIYHPRSLSIERPYSHRLRQAVKDGEAVIETGLPKRKYIYDIQDTGRSAKTDNK